MNRVAGKVAIVTGALKGIGRATAVLLAAEGASVLLTDIDEAPGSTAVSEITEAGGNAIFLAHDVADENSWIHVIAAAREKFGALNILVNNAGIALQGSAEHTSLADWRKLMSVNLDGVFLGTKHAILGMQGSIGSIVNISSIEGIVGHPDAAAYNASKGGVRIFTKSAALHCAKAGYAIRVNSVHPGFIQTPMMDEYLATLGDAAQAREAIGKLHPIGHLGQPIDIAYGVLYLASDESKFVTGSELVIDGGYTAQ